jgi:hypothetical protein
MAARRRCAAGLWYICAMILKDLAVFAVLLAVPQIGVSAQTASHATASRPAVTKPSVVTPPLPAPAANPAPDSDCQSGPCDYRPPHITIATPAPAPAPWPLQDRIAWGANVLLALLGYAGMMVALSLLKKIERQGKFVETAATAAAETAQAALQHVTAILRAERPWVLVTVTPSPSVENGFTIIATNRGRSPARIVAMAAQTAIVEDETQLPGVPEYSVATPDAPPISIILLPGELTSIRSFSRDDVRGLCASDGAFERIENWEERVFLYGKVVYRNLLEPDEAQNHATAWCCRYIHGRQKSALVVAGPQKYNAHS